MIAVRKYIEDALTAAYLKGVSDGKDRLRKQLADEVRKLGRRKRNRPAEVTNENTWLYIDGYNKGLADAVRVIREG